VLLGVRLSTYSIWAVWYVSFSFQRFAERICDDTVRDIHDSAITTNADQIIELTKGQLTFSGTAAEGKTWTAEDDRLAQLIEVFGPFLKLY
jgi:hypothetical protein